jgi:opacity protein-like surface antigen
VSARQVSIAVAATVLALTPAFAGAAEPDSTASAAAEAPVGTAPAAADSTPGVGKNGLVYLVPELEDAHFHVSDDKRRFKNRISFSPAIGQLGENDVFAFRVAYSPNTWLGYEIALGHNPASSLHALLHTFNAIVRYPLRGRIQPYMTLGYGMMTVYPGQAINADPVTKNTLTVGGGLEIYLRDDVALRGELRSATVLGQELGSGGTVAYDYREYTIGFAFYRSLGG